MEHQGHVGEGPDGLQTGNVYLRILHRVHPVGGAHGDGQTVAAAAGHKIRHLLGHGIQQRVPAGFQLVCAADVAQLGLHRHTPGVGVLHHLTGQGDVLFKGQL